VNSDAAFFSPRRWAAVATLIVASSASAATSLDRLDPLDPLVRPAPMNPRAASSMLVAATRAGNRLVTAGERGIVLLSDDHGKTWQQAQVPVSVTITSLYFATPMKGWAVGHSGVVLATTDGGKTWSRQLDGPSSVKAIEANVANSAATIPVPAGSTGTASNPFLDVFFADESNGFAVGAFGLFMRTHDGGKSWTGWEKHIPNPEGNHLYAIRAVGKDIYVVGERGSIYLSADGGESFAAVKSPYEGSLFGVIGNASGGVLVFGLRGHAYLSSDRARSWTEIKVGNNNTWLGATGFPDDRIVMVSQAGEVAQSLDGGANFKLLPGRHPPLNAVVANGREDVLAVGVRGAGTLTLSQAKN
jgi:photosystem II stability/assembly factor-like uncharacterized protein